MKILTIGDVVSEAGCTYLRKMLPALKKEFSADVTIVNGENSAIGNGILPQSADDIFTSGADVITLGNHSLRRREIYEYLDDNEYIIRPYNFHSSAPGKGIAIIDKGYAKIAVINLQGTMFLDQNENPFYAIDKALEEVEDEANIIIVDFHAETTSEKRAMGFYLDGRVSAIFGTHTHVQTSDNQILPNGTGYITDIGMTGTINSVLGVKTDIVIDKFKTNLPSKFYAETEGPSSIEGCLFEIDNKTGKTISTTIFRR